MISIQRDHDGRASAVQGSRGASQCQFAIASALGGIKWLRS
jgi:hypothetical protein